MSQANFVFKSRSERQRDSELVKNYREIGIAAIAAAARAHGRKNHAETSGLQAANTQNRD